MCDILTLIILMKKVLVIGSEIMELVSFHEYPIKNVLDILLKERTTNKNIVFAKNDYIDKDINAKTQITIDLLKKSSKIKIEPRVQKSVERQENRTKKNAEVFTPSWICNKMNNHCDSEWFGREDVFNTEEGQQWRIIESKIVFPKEKTWKDYVKSKRLEITCGEAPYIVSRYDTSTGKVIPIQDRIGILDRKLRIINEHTKTEKTWFEWAKKAYQSVYGYEFQGDNLLIARVNLLNTFVEYCKDRWDRTPTDKELRTISDIISWNFWQMDGINGNTPCGIPQEDANQINILDLYDTVPKEINCKIFDWDAKEIISYKSLKGE